MSHPFGMLGPLKNNPNFHVYELIYGMSGVGFLLLQVGDGICVRKDQNKFFSKI